MEKGATMHSLSDRLKEGKNSFLIENKKIIIQFIFTLFFIAIGIWFIEHEGAELPQIESTLTSARWVWVLGGVLLTALYILLQGLMYVFSFAATDCKVSLFDSTILFIKRNLISIFIPAGGVTSYVFFTDSLVEKGYSKSKILFASTINGFIGILTIVIIAIPAFMYSIFDGTIGSGEWFALGIIVLLIVTLFLVYRSIVNKTIIHRLLMKYIPKSEVFITNLQSHKIDGKKVIYTLLTSIVIDLLGIAFLYDAMLALNYPTSLYAATMGYLVSVVFMIVSPFLRGLGAIEVSMTFVLIRFGYGNVEAIAMTFLYRFFEFWIPLLVGVVTFLSKINKLLMRILPALFLMGLGIINIVSVLTPAIPGRLKNLSDFLPMEIIHASNYLVLIVGFFLLVTATFMLKGLRSAWLFAVAWTIISFVGHITKAIDYEEAIVSLFVFIVLLITHKEYYIKNNPKLRNVGLQTSLLLTFVAVAYGVVGFYFLDKKHFNIDFNFVQSFRFALQNYFLVGSDELIPTDAFAKNFLYSINISGVISISFLIYTLVQSYVPKKDVSEDESALANELLSLYGSSALDYFKTYSDKMIFISESKNAFIAYRIADNYAVALEDPVGKNSDEKKQCIIEFDKYCYENGLMSIFFRVSEQTLDIYRQLNKKELFLGQEGVVDISTFSLTGISKKSLRNAISKVKDRGYKATIHVPPVKDGVLQKVKLVSDEWLKETGRKEIKFSQGMFVWEELKQQTILTVENEEEKIVAFMNIIPDYVKDEATYDLMRKTKDAPNGVMDFILIELFNYLKTQDIKYLNLGFAPMSGINDPKTFRAKSMKFAYEKIKSFSQHKGLREYKEKFEPVWYNKYLIYKHDYDLLKAPSALSKVIKK